MKHEAESYLSSPPADQAEASSDLVASKDILTQAPRDPQDPQDPQDPRDPPSSTLTGSLPASFLRRHTNEGHPVNDTSTHLQPGQPYAESTNERSSVVKDGGYSSQLPVVPKVKPQRNRSDDLFQIGSQYADYTVGAVPGLVIEEQGESPTQGLSYRIFEAMKGPKQKQFLPIDKRKEILTIPNIKSELRRKSLYSDVDWIAEHIWNTKILPHGETSRQVIFAILCKVNKANLIVDFIEEDLYDCHLPFIFKDTAVGEVYYRAESGKKERIELFTKPVWKPIKRDAFENYQGGILPTFFELSYPPDQMVREYRLQDGVLLPFLEDVVQTTDDLKDFSLESLQRQGGFSVVRKVCIHPAHYIPDPNKEANGDTVYFAVKELNFREGDQTKKEAAALKRLNTVNHKHLIRLLATYVQGHRVHMIFPWADGNLDYLWKKTHEPSPESFSTPDRVRWMSKQILGLARGLQEIHYCKPDKGHEDDSKVYGRHGDLKPHNILWFKHDTSVGGVDENVLKIADFGFADFRSKHSRSHVRISAVDGTTPTYEAPEILITKEVSPHYDIWSFGCILLQFAVWYLRGWKGVDEFSQRRLGDQKGAPLVADNFFTITIGAGKKGGWKATKKDSVAKEIEQSKKDAKCDYILELLEYIQDKVLKMEPTHRADIVDIVKKFEELDQRCQEQDFYCTHRIKKVTRTPSALSTITDEFGIPDPASAMVPPVPDSISVWRSGFRGPRNENSLQSLRTPRSSRTSLDLKEIPLARPSSPLKEPPQRFQEARRLAAIHNSTRGGDQDVAPALPRGEPRATDQISESDFGAPTEASDNDQDKTVGLQQVPTRADVALSGETNPDTSQNEVPESKTPPLHSPETSTAPAELFDRVSIIVERSEHNITAPPSRNSRDHTSGEDIAAPGKSQPDLTDESSQTKVANGDGPVTNGHTVQPDKTPAETPRRSSRRQRFVKALGSGGTGLLRGVSRALCIPTT